VGVGDVRASSTEIVVVSSSVVEAGAVADIVIKPSMDVEVLSVVRAVAASYQDVRAASFVVVVTDAGISELIVLDVTAGESMALDWLEVSADDLGNVEGATDVVGMETQTSDIVSLLVAALEASADDKIVAVDSTQVVLTLLTAGSGDEAEMSEVDVPD